jgi:hypothetical protein
MALHARLTGTINGETDCKVLADPGSEHEDMKELVKAKVLRGAARSLQGVEDCSN